MPGMGELVVILLIVLVVFGANKLPGIGDALGRSIKNFRKSSALGEGDNTEGETTATKQVAGGSPQKQLEEGSGSSDGEWEEVVVRRKKKKAES